jgi:hypothetical protein
MCCFSGPVRSVSGTRIFARPLEGGRQLLVYAMSLAIDEDVAMVLPVPVPPGSSDDALAFVDMSKSPTFFESLDALFPRLGILAFGAPQSAPLARHRAPLVVHDVGDFQASFVPTQRDFDRLDARFRLAPEAWAALPQYGDWGFAVFKLRSRAPSGFIEGVKRVLGQSPPPEETPRHPMAFELPLRDPSKLFYPTVHVHDGKVHPTARFDHTFYGQGIGVSWEATPKTVGEQWVPEEVKRFLRPDAVVQRSSLVGERPNADLFVPVHGG